jgi:glycerol kinase
MVTATHILAVDQGTTSTRAIVFDGQARPVAVAQRELTQHYPERGWVEHDPEDIWRDTLAVMHEAIAGAGLRADGIAAIGITNQRETVVVWDRASGTPIHRAIVWQDRRTAGTCDQLRAGGAEPLVRARTGLLLDPYFSGTKLAWILDNVAGARARAERGELAFGTIDSFLLWRLTGGAVHATDPTNAGRTLLFDIHAQRWDEDLLALLGVPAALLPEVKDNSGLFGHTAQGLFETAIPIAGMAGDQQAALFGQGCFAPGMAKATYGTGCFMLLNTGEAVASHNRLLTTPAYRLGGKTSYALEGSIFVAGAAIKWLRDGIGVISHVSQTSDMATSVSGNHGVYMVPAFVGLGAPHWTPEARGLICGLTLDSTAAHLARAALESVAYQTLRPCLRDDRRRCRRACNIAGRWRHVGERLALPVPRRHDGRAGGPSGGGRDHGTRRCAPRGACDGPVERSRCPRADLVTRSPFHAGNGHEDPQYAAFGLAGRAAPDAARPRWPLTGLAAHILKCISP